MAGKQGIFSGQAERPDGVFDRIGVEFETTVIEEAGEPLPMSEAITDIFGQPGARGDHLDSCFSNHCFRAAMIGAECSRRAASLTWGDAPRTVASMAYSVAICRTAASAIGDFVLRTSFTNRRRTPAMHQHPWPLRAFDAREPIISVIAV